MQGVARARHNTTIVLGALIALLGLALIVSTIVRGGGPAAIGVIVGAALAVFGAARAYLALGARSHERP